MPIYKIRPTHEKGSGFVFFNRVLLWSCMYIMTVFAFGPVFQACYLHSQSAYSWMTTHPVDLQSCRRIMDNGKGMCLSRLSKVSQHKSKIVRLQIYFCERENQSDGKSVIMSFHIKDMQRRSHQSMWSRPIRSPSLVKAHLKCSEAKWKIVLWADKSVWILCGNHRCCNFQHPQQRNPDIPLHSHLF